MNRQCHNTSAAASRLPSFPASPETEPPDFALTVTHMPEITPSTIPTCAPPREPTRPKTPPPPNACDCHAHVFGPATQFPYAADRSYTPPNAPLAKYRAMLDTVGCAR